MARRRKTPEVTAHLPRLDQVLRQSLNKHHIVLRGGGLSEVPPVLRTATALKTLDLADNRLTALPDWLDTLPALESVLAEGNQLRVVAPGRATLELDLAQVLRLPVDTPWERLRLVCDADTPAGAVGELLNDPMRCAALWRLSLRPGRLAPFQDKPIELPAALQPLLAAIDRFTGLRTLNLKSLALGELPVGMTRLHQLKSLGCNHIGLKSLPHWLAKLPLEQLGLAGNILTALPDWLPELVRLRELDLFYNARLKHLPSALFRMPALEVLELGGCPIREIPRDVLGAASLVELNVDTAQLVSPPPEVASLGLTAIRDYWRQRDEVGIDYLSEAKLIILGEGGAGKSTLLRKILDPTAQVDPQEMSTEGIDVARWQFPTTIRPRSADGAPLQALQRDFQVNIWDFGGQEIYHATHQFFLTRRSVYLLVCDDRNEDTDFHYWLQAVEALSDGSPLLIVQNEKQDRSRDIGLADLRARFPNLRGAWSTNLATNRGLQPVVDAIRRELEGLPHVGTALPATWKRVREALEQDTRDHIGLDAYLALCEQHGFTRREDKLQLSQYLHDLGICLHFQDDPLLKHTVVLKPTWGTDAVYRVLDDPQVKAARGRFQRADLARIWCETRYQGMQDELLRLMAKFQLCYALDEAGTRWMAPQLLSADRPAHDWPAQGSLVVRWQYDFMPKGLLTRFTVTQHHLIADDAPLWRSGVVLSRDGTQAEVVEDYPRRRIVARVHGADARGLLAIVDDQVQRLNQIFPRLKVQRWLPCPCSECRVKPEAEAFALDKLTKMALRGQDIQCHESGEMVSAADLLRDVLPSALTRAQVLDTDLLFAATGRAARPGLPADERMPPTEALAASPPEVLVSYASGPASNMVVEALDKALREAGIRLLRDRQDVRYKDSIGQFMQRIATSRCVVVVLSKKYFESEYCMTELVGMLKAQDLRERIVPIVLEDADIDRPTTCARYARHWEREAAELDAELKQLRGDNLARLQAKLTEYTEFRRLFDDVSHTLRDMNALTPEEHAATGYAELLAAVRRQLGML